jgi:hypothetical protein
MSDPPNEFGKRKPAPLPSPAASPPVKRSRHVALLLTGTLAVGGGAYALTPRQSCEPAAPGIAAPASPQATACGARAFSSSGGRGGYGSSSRSSFFGGESASPSSPGSTAPSGETTRGGFGGFARAFAAHFSGGS